MSGPLPLAAPSFDEAEVRAVTEVVRSAWLTMGPRTAAFEDAFAAMVGARHAVMASSCTAALHLAFAALGIGPGDEVIVPSLTFVATANSVAYTGAVPRFADICSTACPLIDPAAVEALVGPRTAAVCVVHYAGYVGDVGALRRVCDRHGLALVEDAAHAPGARAPDGRMAGALGDAACFSFFSNKNLVTGEGGMITTDDGGTAERLRLLRAHGMRPAGPGRRPGADDYEVVLQGFNYRPSEIEAALGLVQLAKQPRLLARRRELVARYRALVAERPDVGTIPFAGRDEGSACHILPLLAPDPGARREMRESARSRGVQSSVHYPPAHLFPHFGPQPALPVTEDFARRELTLPLFPGMADADVDRALAAARVRTAA
jgi:dTDP-4-amino-4,6-dideoxygalactose transaminase